MRLKNICINIIQSIGWLERKYKVLTYMGLLYLTVSMFFLRQENTMLTARVVEVETINKTLVANMVIYNRSFENFPHPIWEKVKRGEEFIIQYLNPNYVQAFGHLFNYNRYKYIGKTDFDIQPHSLARQYYEDDLAVTVTGKPLKVVESFIDKDSVIRKIEVIKWRDIYNRDTLIYGMVLKKYQKKCEQ